MLTNTCSAAHRLDAKVPKDVSGGQAAYSSIIGYIDLAVAPSLPMQDSAGFLIRDGRAAMPGPGEQMPSNPVRGERHSQSWAVLHLVVEAGGFGSSELERGARDRACV